VWYCGVVFVGGPFGLFFFFFFAGNPRGFFYYKYYLQFVIQYSERSMRSVGE